MTITSEDPPQDANCWLASKTVRTGSQKQTGSGKKFYELMKQKQTSIKMTERGKCGKIKDQLMTQTIPSLFVKHSGGSVMCGTSGTGTLACTARQHLAKQEKDHKARPGF